MKHNSNGHKNFILEFYKLCDLRTRRKPVLHLDHFQCNFCIFYSWLSKYQIKLSCFFYMFVFFVCSTKSILGKIKSKQPTFLFLKTAGNVHVCIARLMTSQMLRFVVLRVSIAFIGRFSWYLKKVGYFHWYGYCSSFWKTGVTFYMY